MIEKITKNAISLIQGTVLVIVAVLLNLASIWLIYKLVLSASWLIWCGLAIPILSSIPIIGMMIKESSLEIHALILVFFTPLIFIIMVFYLVIVLLIFIIAEILELMELLYKVVRGYFY